MNFALEGWVWFGHPMARWSLNLPILLCFNALRMNHAPLWKGYDFGTLKTVLLG